MLSSPSSTGLLDTISKAGSRNEVVTVRSARMDDEGKKRYLDL